MWVSLWLLVASLSHFHFTGLFVTDAPESTAFRRAAEAYVARAIATPETAAATMRRLGIHDERGELTGVYRG